MSAAAVENQLQTSGLLAGAAIGWIDIAVTIAYIVGIVALGCWAGTRRKNKDDAARAYFLAGGTLRWPVIGLALFATNISCVHLVSLAQSGYDTGLLNGNFEWMAAFTLIMLGLFFAPFYIRSGVATLPDFLERRYCRACRDWLAVLSIVSAVTIHIGFSFLTGGIVLSGIFPEINIYACIIVIAALTGLYTIIGGLMAVVVTEAIQTIVLIIGASLITWFAWERMGGWEPMQAVLAVQDFWGADNMDKISMLRPHGDSSGMPWYSILLGYPVLGIWYWCADQTIVQRVLGAKDENHARVGPLFAGVIKILPVFIFVMPGLFAFTLIKSGALDDQALIEPESAAHRRINMLEHLKLNPEKLSGLNWTDQDQEILQRIDFSSNHLYRLKLAGVYDENSILKVDSALQKGLIQPATAEFLLRRAEPIYNSKHIYGAMITQLLPTGMVGIMVAALLAALMSTVSGALNSISTLFSFDLYKRIRPDATDERLVFVGRVTAFIALLVAIGLVPLLNRYESIFNGLNEIIAHIAPPITCVFLLGVFWKKASAMSAKLTMWAGSALGVVVFILTQLEELTPAGPWLRALSGDSFMMMAFYLLCACIIMQIIFASIWPANHTEDSSRLYWRSPLEPVRDKGWPFPADYRFLALLLFAAMVVLYSIFH